MAGLEQLAQAQATMRAAAEAGPVDLTTLSVRARSCAVSVACARSSVCSTRR